MISAEDIDRLRQRFDYRCAYCGVSEIDSGGRLTVDHFWPVSAGGKDDFANLVYACFRCNVFKGAYHPRTQNVGDSPRILHPLLDDLKRHIKLDEQTGRLVALTSAGEFHISQLQLNRDELLAHRRDTILVELALAERQQLRELAAELDRLLEIQIRAITRLEKLLKKPRGKRHRRR